MSVMQEQIRRCVFAYDTYTQSLSRAISNTSGFQKLGLLPRQPAGEEIKPEPGITRNVPPMCIYTRYRPTANQCIIMISEDHVTLKTGEMMLEIHRHKSQFNIYNITVFFIKEMQLW